MDNPEELFCHIDDFCQLFEPHWHPMLLGEGVQNRQHQRSLSSSRDHDDSGELPTTTVSKLQSVLLQACPRALARGLPWGGQLQPLRGMDAVGFANISPIEHSRHRSPNNFMVNVICGLIAYCHQPKKPSLNLDFALPPSA